MDFPFLPKHVYLLGKTVLVLGYLGKWGKLPQPSPPKKDNDNDDKPVCKFKVVKTCLFPFLF